MGGLLSPPTTLLVLLSLLFLLSSPSSFSEAQTQRGPRSLLSYRRNPLGSADKEENPSLLSPPKKKSSTTATTSTTKNKTKLLKPIKPKKSNSTTILTTKTLNSTTKPPKPSNSTKLLKPIKPTKLNSTTSTAAAKTKLKSLNSTSSTTTKLLKKSPTDPLPLPKNKTQSKTTTTTKKPPSPTTSTTTTTKKQPKSLLKPVQIMPWLDDSDDDDDLITEFRELPAKFHEALLPDLEKISTKSKAYLTLANKEFTKTFKPIVGNKYAPTIASVTSTAFLLLPLLLVTLLFHHLRAYLSLHKILLSIQAYLAIYFATLSLTAVATGLEPLRFFCATSPGSYVYTQVLQMLGYVLYLLLQLMHLVVVFSTTTSTTGSGGEGGGLGSKALGLAQMIVGLAVGLHYYAAVFHRAVLGEPPKTNWKIHAVYAGCFLVICAFARVDRRKKAYLQEGHDDDGKKS